MTACAVQIGKWACKQAISDAVAPTHFLPMKTPFSQHLLAQQFPASCPCQDPNTVQHLCTFCTERGYRLGLIINLAAHACLYAADLPAGVPMQQVPMAAKVIPPEEQVQAALSLADALWARDPEAYIAVHCDYGAELFLWLLCTLTPSMQWLVHVYTPHWHSCPALQ